MTPPTGAEGRGPIEDFLDQVLISSASMHAHERRHLLAEAEDHLRTDADTAVAAGVAPFDAESQAVARFGPAVDFVRADRDRNLPPLRTFLTQLLNTGALLAGIGAIAVGASGLIAAAIRLVAGNHALVGLPAGSSLAPADCVRWLHLAPHAASCSAAAADDWANETVYYRLALGLFGALLLLIRRALVNRVPGTGRRALPALPALATDTIAVILFGAAAALTLGLGLDALVVSPDAGAGQWLSAAPVALAATAFFGSRLIHEVYRPSA